MQFEFEVQFYIKILTKAEFFRSVDPYGLIGQWLTDALNPSVYTFEVAPVMTIMEETVLKEMRKFLGYPDGQGDGIFCPGGSIANGYAINCARFYAFPEVKVSNTLFIIFNFCTIMFVKL